MSSQYGKNIRISIFGQSHSQAVGVCIDGLSPGFKIDQERLQSFLRRRAPGKNDYSTPRKEQDNPEFLSGLVDGVTCGAPLSAIIRNTDVKSEDYGPIADSPRPAHADYSAHVKYSGFQDVRGGGHFSGRLTAPLCVAGGICLQMLEAKGIQIAAHALRIADVSDVRIDPLLKDDSVLQAMKSGEFPVIDKDRGREMMLAIKKAAEAGDSLGGIIECVAAGLPPGLGDPIFDGMENRIAKIVFAIPAVKGIEFGNGFESASLLGSQNNDGFYMQEGKVKTKSNNHGGILGGITSGMPLLFRVPVKPTPSIAVEQDSVSLSEKRDKKLTVAGRHDPCIVPRAVPCVEAASAIAIYDALCESGQWQAKNGQVS